MGFDQPYRTEAGDVLLSLQGILAGESPVSNLGDELTDQPRTFSAGWIDAASADPGPVGEWLPTSWGAEPLADHRATAIGSSANDGREPPIELLLIDASTGAGTLRALRRDLASAREWGARNGGPAVVWLVVEPVAEVRARDGDAAAEALLTAVVELVPFMVRARDRIYRTGPDELALLMPDTDDEGMEVALERLVDKVPKVLAERRLGEVRLVPRVRFVEERGALVAR
jgi:GGDEF domain-containing protein